jgi:hypothetical protein
MPRLPVHAPRSGIAFDVTRWCYAIPGGHQVTLTCRRERRVNAILSATNCASRYGSSSSEFGLEDFGDGAAAQMRTGTVVSAAIASTAVNTATSTHQKGRPVCGSELESCPVYSDLAVGHVAGRVVLQGPFVCEAWVEVDERQVFDVGGCADASCLGGGAVRDVGRCVGGCRPCSWRRCVAPVAKAMLPSS